MRVPLLALPDCLIIYIMGNVWPMQLLASANPNIVFEGERLHCTIRLAAMHCMPSCCQQLQLAV